MARCEIWSHCIEGIYPKVPQMQAHRRTGQLLLWLNVNGALLAPSRFEKRKPRGDDSVFVVFPDCFGTQSSHQVVSSGRDRAGNGWPLYKRATERFFLCTTDLVANGIMSRHAIVLTPYKCSPPFTFVSDTRRFGWDYSSWGVAL